MVNSPAGTGAIGDDSGRPAQAVEQYVKSPNNATNTSILLMNPLRILLKDPRLLLSFNPMGGNYKASYLRKATTLML
jgi:hypothetical protein